MGVDLCGDHDYAEIPSSVMRPLIAAVLALLLCLPAAPASANVGTTLYLAQVLRESPSVAAMAYCPQIDGIECIQ